MVAEKRSLQVALTLAEKVLTPPRQDVKVLDVAQVSQLRQHVLPYSLLSEACAQFQQVEICILCICRTRRTGACTTPLSLRQRRPRTSGTRWQW